MKTLPGHAYVRVIAVLSIALFTSARSSWGQNSITVMPSSGTGVTQTFALNYTSASQAQEHIFFNNALTGNGSCYLFYDRPSNTLNITNNQGTAASQSATPGSSSVLSNGQCSVTASSASVSVSDTTVNLNVTITFNASFAGVYNIYANIADASYVEGAWQQIGTWIVPANTGNSITVTPSSGSGLTQTFVLSYTSGSQAQDYVFFNDSVTGNGACFLLYDRPSNTLNIVNDQGTAVSQSVTPGGSGLLSGNRCSVAASSASVWASGNTVNLSLTINFSPSFAGTHNIYANIADAAYVAGTWQQIGTWTVPGSAPPPHTVVLDWIASTSPDVIGYYVYRGNTSGGPYARVSALDAATEYSDLSVQGGQTYFYVATAVNNFGVESGYSTEVQVAIPFP